METCTSNISDQILDDMDKAGTWQKRNKDWLSSGIDIKSINCVCNILPDVFRKRIKTGQYDYALNKCVKGGDYEVPLWYVTKAFDILLKGELFGGYVATEEDLNEENMDDDFQDVDRTLEKAIVQNDEMKAIWKEYMGIDIDAYHIDFEQFNLHMQPSVTREEEFEYFSDVPYGVLEWGLLNVNYPSDDNVTFECVSRLMEMTAITLRYRDNFFGDRMFHP